MRSRHGPLAPFARLPLVTSCKCLSLAAVGWFPDWQRLGTVGVSVGGIRPFSVVFGSCRFIPSCLTIWPHDDLIGRVFRSRWCRLQQRGQRCWGQGLHQSDPQHPARCEKWLIEGCRIVLWGRMPLSFTPRPARGSP